MSLPRGALLNLARRVDEELRRADRRFERDIPIEFIHAAEVHVGHTRNMSLGGVFIETETKLPYAARIELRFHIPTMPDVIEVGGQVRWCESSEEVSGLGVQFDGLRAREVWALNRFFNHLR